MRVLARAGYFLGLPVLLIALWGLLTLDSDNFFVPSPGEVAGTFFDVWVGDRFAADVLPSVGRLLSSLALAIAIGTALGLLIGSVSWLRELLEPLFEFIRAIPATILVPILMLLVGLNDAAKVSVIVIGCVWPVLLNTVEGVRAVDSVLSDTARVYGITGVSRLRYLVVRSASPQIMAGIRQSLSIGLILMVVSEMFAASDGLGFAIIQFQRVFAIPEMWSGIILLGLLGVALASVFSLVQSRVLAWYYGQKEAADAR
jgi:ABC-type nitrate/sulfonate/bicarbonate transport system permease component